MSKQITLSDITEQDRLLDVEYSDIMGQSYIDYSMSTICQRAVPDIKDGLKPVQRRIIYDMSKINAGSETPHRKVSRIVGDTMGKFHPHGDASIEDALVVLAQDFKKQQPLVDGHGNFGSIEGDQHAASRYIEARLQSFSEDVFLSELKNDTVDFISNYDELEVEPVVLPALLPNFLINGSEGIAVGMTTNVPPHNIGEVIDGEIAYIKDNKITTSELMKHVKGPDFPSGGIISNKEALASIYETGEGKFKIRGKIEEEPLKNGKTNLVITEIPYTMIGMGISKFLNDVAALVENRTITDISDISNQSSKDGVRIVIELKKGTDVENIKNILYKKTKLEDTFSVYMLAIANGKPETLSLKDVYKYHSDFLYEINNRKYSYLLQKEKDKVEIQEGLIKAVDMIDLIIAVLRGSKNQKDAKECLMSGNITNIKLKTKTLEKQASKLNYTEAQTDAILGMKLARLIGLELESLEKEHSKSLKNIASFEKLLGNKKEMRKHIISVLESLKKQYGTKRKTALKNYKEIKIVHEEKILEVAILIDRFGYVKTVDKSVYEKNPVESKYVILTETDKTLFFISDKGKFYKAPVKDLPYVKLRDKGTPIDNFVGKTYSGNNEIPIYFGILEELKDNIMCTSLGYIKKMEASEVSNLKKNGSQIIKLQENETLIAFGEIGEGIFLVSNDGYAIKIKTEKIPYKKKSARGIIGIKLQEQDEVAETKIVDKLKQDSNEKIKSIRYSNSGGKGRKISN